jgi:drug/metabolite transporter (DMT)-like permease
MTAPSSRNGSEPATARSPVGLRMVLAVFGVLACGVASAYFLEAARSRTGTSRNVLSVLAVLALLGGVVAVADYVILTRRRHRKP